MPTPQIDRLFETLITIDEDEEEDLILLRQEVSAMSDEELKTVLRVAKNYRRNYNFFYDILKQEKDYRRGTV